MSSIFKEDIYIAHSRYVLTYLPFVKIFGVSTSFKFCKYLNNFPSLVRSFILNFLRKKI